MSRVSVEEILRGSLRDVENLTKVTSHGTKASRELLDELKEADRALAARLRRESKRLGGRTARFTGASALAYQQQIRVQIAYLEKRLGGFTETQATKAVEQSMKRSVRTLKGLEKRFVGITRPVRLDQRERMSQVIAGNHASLLGQIPTSVDRYGRGMIAEFEKRMRVGLVQGMTMDEMIASLTGHAGPDGRVSMAATLTPQGVLRLREEDIPEGLFVRYRSWAERLVRTELAHSYNQARRVSYEAMREDTPDLQKKIVAILDTRTAPDSIAVNGQVRELEDYFVDGAGRRYLYPPARPNDRETTIPWRPAWDEEVGEVTDPVERALLGELSEDEEDALIEQLKGKKEPKKKEPKKKEPKKKEPKKKKEPPTDEEIARAKADLAERLRAKREAEAKLKPALAAPAPAAPTVPVTEASATPRAERMVADYEKEFTWNEFNELSITGKRMGSLDFGSGGWIPRFTDPAPGGWKQIPLLSDPLRFDPDDEGDNRRQREAAKKIVEEKVRFELEKTAKMTADKFDRAKLTKAFLDEDGPEVRAQIRAILHDNGVLPRDPLYSGTNATVIEVDQAQMPKGAAAYHGWDGKVGVHGGALKSHGKELEEGVPYGVHIMVHEELHGSTPTGKSGGGFYVGAGAAIEEATVEMAARKIIVNTFGQKSFGGAYWFGPYQNTIDDVGKVVKDVLAPKANMLDVIADAGIKMRSAGASAGKGLDTPDDIIDLFIDSLPPSTAEQREELRTRLRLLDDPSL